MSGNEGRSGHAEERVRSAAKRRELTERIVKVVPDGSISKIAQELGQHPETVRRHCRGGPPSALFLTDLCRVQGVCPRWLLLDEGSVETRHEVEWFLGQATVSELFAEIATRIDDRGPSQDRIARESSLPQRFRGLEIAPASSLGVLEDHGL